MEAMETRDMELHQQIGTYDAKSKFSEIIRRVGAGESFTITYRGEPVADIIPRKKRDNTRLRAAIEYLANSRKPVVSDEDVRAMISEGRA